MNRFWLVFLLLLSTGIFFALNVLTLTGVAGTVPYLLVILFTFWIPGPWSTVLFSSLITGLAAAGLFWPSRDGNIEVSVMKILLILATIWASAIVVILQKRRDVLLINSRKDLERKVEKHSNELQFLSNLVEQTPQSVAIVAPDGHFILVNRAFEKLTGLSFEDLQRQQYEELFPEQRREEQKELFKKLITTGRPKRYQTQCQAKDGKTIPVQVVADLHRNKAGQSQYVYLFMTDIRERRAAEEKTKLREITLLHELGELLLACVSIEEAYGVVKRISNQLFPGESGAILLIDDGQKLVEVVARWGSSLAVTDKEVLRAVDCWALRRGRVHHVDDTHSNLLCNHLPQPSPAAYLCVPLVAQGQTLGVFHLYTYADRFTESKQKLAETVAEQTALALANLRLQETLRQQSVRDSLTGLFNRRYLEETLQREIYRSLRNKRPIGVIMIDIDHFKRINDAHGHSAGDTILKEFGKIFQTCVRSGDIACRPGGDEFILVLPETSLDVALRRAHDIKVEAESVEISHGGEAIRSITLSIGVAAFPDHGTTGDELLRAVDTTLYRAKQEGRNRVLMARQSAQKKVRNG